MCLKIDFQHSIFHVVVCSRAAHFFTTIPTEILYRNVYNTASLVHCARTLDENNIFCIYPGVYMSTAVIIHCMGKDTLSLLCHHHHGRPALVWHDVFSAQRGSAQLSSNRNMRLLVKTVHVSIPRINICQPIWNVYFITLRGWRAVARKSGPIWWFTNCVCL